MLPSAAELVAQYLRDNQYEETLDSFIKEAGLASDIGTFPSSPITIEKILQEKKTFDISLRFEKLGVEEVHSWKNPAPSVPNVLSTLPAASNILSIHAFDLALSATTEPQQCIAITTADRRLNLIDPTTSSCSLLQSYMNFQDSPILDLITFRNRYILVASMSGRLTLCDVSTNRVLDERKDHSKYLVKLTKWSDGHSTIIATAGWDAKVFLYRLEANSDSTLHLGEPYATMTVPSIPETIVFVQTPDTSSPVLLLTRRDSTFLYYYSPFVADMGNKELVMLGKQNVAPHSNAWVAFTPADVQLCPTDPSLAAIATSSIPHMKLIVVRLLIPPQTSSHVLDTPSQSAERYPNSERDLGIISPSHNIATLTQASQARTELMEQNREEAAISINITTMATQTTYSTPKLTWRPDGSGIYVSSDDGVVRGFESSSGKLMTSLQAHEPGTKIRCLCAGSVRVPPVCSTDVNPAIEYLITGGFDQKVVLWRSA